MGLQINTNVNALNAYRNLTGTQSSMTTSLERLSSGLRINRAADDAAGLAISEKLRSQVNGLNQAQANAQDGVSLIQTAEGALNETHAILQRMRTLAVQSASDTNTDADRKAIQKEVNALVKEIDSTTGRTQFNGMNLLDGSFKDKSLQIGANQSQTMGLNIANLGSKGLNLSARTEITVGGTAITPAATTNAGTATSGTAGSLATGLYTVADNNGVLEMRNAGGTAVGTLSADGKTWSSTNQAGDGTAATVTLDTALKAGDTLDLAAASATVTPAKVDVAYGGQATVGTYTVAGTAGSLTITGPDATVTGKVSADGKTAEFSNGTSLTFGTSLKAGTFAVGAAANPAGEVGTAAIDLSSRAGAVSAVRMIDDAIGQISNQRADLGALQNRLQHTVKNLGVSAENLAASESRIRDTDMAKEMTNFTRSQILQQAGVSMLAQANQSSQSVLKLLG